MTDGPVRIRDDAGARWITLHRPPLNVLDVATIRALAEAVAGAGAARAVVFRSALDGTFSAGSDVADHAPARAPAMLDAFHGLARRLHELPQVTVAAVDGRCLGGGCELVLCCDVVVATPRASFGQPEIDVGCFPPVASVVLPRLIGRAAFEMVLTGEAISAAEAVRQGLVNRMVDDTDAAAEEVVRRVAAKSGAVLALARRAVRDGAAGTFAEALDRVDALYRRDLLATEDAAEGVRAFLEKRKPAWRDR